MMSPGQWAVEFGFVVTNEISSAGLLGCCDGKRGHHACVQHTL